LEVVKANGILPEVEVIVERHDVKHGGRVGQEKEKRSGCCSFVSCNARSKVGSGG
jgi:hypothetical protein